MNKIFKAFNSKNISIGYLFFVIHFITEVLCFYYLESIKANEIFFWIVPMVYDCLAFVPQGLFGALFDKYRKVNSNLIGSILLIIGFSLLFIFPSISIYVSLFILCIGNCVIHISGAERTLRLSEGKMAHSSIFVAGGSFGVITGKILAKYINYKIIILIGLLLIPLSLFVNKYNIEEKTCKDFYYHNDKKTIAFVIVLAVFVVAIRGYIGYGIPSSWNKTMFEAFLLYSFMGIGKAMGGILIDSVGIKKTIFISTIVSLPFLCFGDKIMILSLIGVMFFSMTMAITLAIIVSCIKDSPGIAFGFTTIGLFLGTMPVFFVSIKNILYSIILLITIGIIAFIILNGIAKENK